MRKFFVLFFVLFLHGEILQKDVASWLNNSDLVCKQFGIDTTNMPKFRAYIELNNGEILVFSSVKSMLLYFYEVGLKHNDVGIKELLVTDFKSGDVFSASSGFYVFGSRIVSVKGDDLIPFKNEFDAENFKATNSGHKILKFEQINKKLIDYLR